MITANLIWVLTGCVLIGAGASVVGSFAYLRKQSLVGDAIAHSILPGVVLAFILFHTKSQWALFPGALLAGWLSLISMDTITRKSRLKPDTAIATVLSVFFAIGIVLLTYVQSSGMGNHSGLDSFLFGQAAAMLPADIQIIMGVDVAILISVTIFYPYLKIMAFDKGFAQTIGIPVGGTEFLLSTLTILAVATGIQVVGVVLMAALIITPATAARFFAARLSRMIYTAVALGALSAVMGVWISYSLPGMPTGPWIVVVLTLFALLAFFVAPRRGLMSRWIRRRRHQSKITEENILKAHYNWVESGGVAPMPITWLVGEKKYDSRQVDLGVKRLVRQNLAIIDSVGLYLTEMGEKEAARIVRLHRLWELYLNHRLNYAQDHVHHSAEAIEHILTPELEAALIRELDFPQYDPHQSVIPGIKPKP